MGATASARATGLWSPKLPVRLTSPTPSRPKIATHPGDRYPLTGLRRAAWAVPGDRVAAVGEDVAGVHRGARSPGRSLPAVPHRGR